MATPVTITITCPAEWLPPEGLELGDSGSDASDMQKYVKTFGMFARNGATSMGVERQDVFDIPVEFCADPALQSSIMIEYMLSSAMLVTMTEKDLANWTAKNIAGQMTNFVGNRPDIRVNVTVTLHTGERAVEHITKMVGRR